MPSIEKENKPKYAKKRGYRLSSRIYSVENRCTKLLIKVTTISITAVRLSTPTPILTLLNSPNENQSNFHCIIPSAEWRTSLEKATTIDSARATPIKEVPTQPAHLPRRCWLKIINMKLIKGNTNIAMERYKIASNDIMKTK